MFGKYEEDQNQRRLRHMLALLRVLIMVVSLAGTFLFAHLTGMSFRSGDSFIGLVDCFCLYRCFQSFSDMLFKEPSDWRIFLHRFIGKT